MYLHDISLDIYFLKRLAQPKDFFFGCINGIIHVIIDGVETTPFCPDFIF